ERNAFPRLRLSGQDMLTGQRLCRSQSHQESVLAALNQQRKEGLFCDVTLIAGQQKFHAHKAVLASCSDYFRAMFSLCMVESEAQEVTLQGVTSEGLKQSLDFAYTGQIMLEPGVIQDVLSAGSHLQLLELLSLCSHYLIQVRDTEKNPNAIQAPLGHTAVGSPAIETPMDLYWPHLGLVDCKGSSVKE
ncbi:hypothetical protein Z043_102409, partial [Scleropages formosus]